MALINTMEQIVELTLKDIMENDTEFCGCPQCVEDVECLALNALPPKYVSTAKGELYSRLSQVMIKQHSIDVHVACLNAIDFVKAHPHHNH